MVCRWRKEQRISIGLTEQYQRLLSDYWSTMKGSRLTVTDKPEVLQFISFPRELSMVKLFNFYLERPHIGHKSDDR